MAAPPRKRHLGAEQRRALQLLAAWISTEGDCTDIGISKGFM